VLQPSGGATWKNAAVVADARSLPGLVVYRFSGSLYYANANLFFEQANLLLTGPSPLRCFCIDAAAIPDIDYSGGETPRQLYGVLTARGIRLVIAAPLPAVVSAIDRYGLAQELRDDSIFPSVDAAVAAFRRSDETSQ